MNHLGLIIWKPSDLKGHQTSAIWKGLINVYIYVYNV